MKTKKPNAELLWKQIEDHLVSRLRLSVSDRVVYWHLLRHSRLEGNPVSAFLWTGSLMEFTFVPVRSAQR